jgi:D-ribose pyranose/furanose isomerase RbsD
MLKHQLIHPKISEVLARAGHHSVILIADGNYPVWGKKGPHAELVSLNLSPGIPTVAQVLRAVLSRRAGRRRQHDGHPTRRLLRAEGRAARVG